jgi:pimeloyl-ACP methyl ester carboxylesterase
MVIGLALLVFASSLAPASEVHRVDLGDAVLELPDGYRPDAGRIDIMLHLHGAVNVVERACADSGWPGALLVFNRKGLSSVYAEPFRDRALLPRLLEKSRAAIADTLPGMDLREGRLFVSSFSAGFGGVRELLADPEHFARIDGLILADSLYAGYTGNPADRRIDPAKMTGFRKFAAEAAAGRKIMIVTHSAQVPTGYASTTETADDLIARLDGQAQRVDQDWGDGWRLKRRFAKGRLLVLGFAGDGPDDHMRHLRRLGAIWRTAWDQTTRTVEIPIGKSGEVQVREILARLAAASGVVIDRPVADLTLSAQGLARSLTKTLLSETLGAEVAISYRSGVMVISIDDKLLAPDRRQEWLRRLGDLSDRATEASRRRQAYGMRALGSFRPNDPSRPTICLVHGLNSSSGGFIYMIPWLEQAGYGIVVYDYPFNRAISDSCQAFARDWAAFRAQVHDRFPWMIVAHSMGALLARSLVEDDATWAGDVASLVMIAPVNQGSHLAKVQTVMQLVNGLQAIKGKNTAQAMTNLADGLGQAAQDMLPGSPFLISLNRRPRRQGISYHVIAGDRGFLTREGRLQIEARLDLVKRSTGILGRVTEMATAELPEMLDELTDDTGDGCVAIARTRLEGVADHITIHANHAELIRAPLLFSEPGPVACMPDLLRMLKGHRESKAQGRPR